MSTSITTIQSTDLITNSRADINNNFDSLLVNKLETSVLDTDTTLAANSDSKVPTQKAVKQYVDAGGNVNASTTAKGIVEEATLEETIAGTAVGATGARLFVNPENLLKTTVYTYDYSGSPYTWTKQSGLKALLVQAWGGGASGSVYIGSVSDDEGIGGGGGGAYVEKWFTPSQLGATETVTVGSGGAAKVGSGVGNDGTNSTFGSLLTAAKGKASLSTYRVGGDGGAVLFDYGIGGSSGSNGSNSYFGGGGGGGGSPAEASGSGGSSIYGGGGGGGADTATSSRSGGLSFYGGNGGAGAANGSGNATATSGSTPAGGGGGAFAGTTFTGTSGAGGDGRIIVTEFY